MSDEALYIRYHAQYRNDPSQAIAESLSMIIPLATKGTEYLMPSKHAIASAISASDNHGIFFI
jgi:hypothetical protein